MNSKSILILLMVFTVGCTSSDNNTEDNTESSRWNEGGTLHKARVIAWKNATTNNKLATSADFAATASFVSSRVSSSGDFDTLKIYAKQLNSCIDEALLGPINDNADIRNTAATCMVVLGW